MCKQDVVVFVISGTYESGGYGEIEKRCDASRDFTIRELVNLAGFELHLPVLFNGAIVKNLDSTVKGMESYNEKRNYIASVVKYG